MIRVVAISDTHGYHGSLAVPPGDVLVHAGDLTHSGTLEEVSELDAWLASLPHRHKIVIAGNHDWCFEETPDQARARLAHATYLMHEACTAAGLRVFGSPWQPWFLDWSFNLPRGPALAEKWSQIPDDTELLVTHCPPAGIGDAGGGGERLGCVDLRARVAQVQPRLHVFGHIHEGRGLWRHGPTTFVNAASWNPGDGPFVVDLDVDGGG